MPDDDVERPKRLTASQRLAAALGRSPFPEPTAEEERDLEAKLDATDEEAERFYKIRRYYAA